jgi:hypothetical protein
MPKNQAHAQCSANSDADYSSIETNSHQDSGTPCSTDPYVVARYRVRQFHTLVVEVERLWERPLVRRLCYAGMALVAHVSGVDVALLRRILAA